MPDQPQEPRNLLRLWACVVFGLALWFVPAPAGLPTPAWHVFAVFAATILAFLIRPLPMGPCVLLGLLVLSVSGEFYYADPGAIRNYIQSQLFARKEFITGEDIDAEEIDALNLLFQRYQFPGFIEGIGVLRLPGRDPGVPPLDARVTSSFKQALSGYADTTTWLVVAAFLISGAVIRSGLGRRVALSMVRLFGRTTLGLGYAIGMAELLLAPFIPSNTARGGGVMAPIVNSLSQVLGSHPDDSPKRAGEYLTLCGAHLNLVTAAMFLTGMAANPLVNQAAADVFGAGTGLSWGGWLLGALVPGLITIALIPLVLYVVAPPQAAAAGEARAKAVADLEAMGPWTARQVMTTVILLGMLLLWTTGPLQERLFGFHLHTTVVALMGVTAMVVLGVERWRDVTGNAAAWDALIWLGGLISMANALREIGFTAWFADSVGGHVTGMPPVVLAVTLAVVYFLSMYAFSMLTGHIMAFAGVFFAAALAAGAPPLLMVALIAYFSNLCGCTTNYSTGPVVIYYGLGYVSSPRWFFVGAVIGLMHLAVWLGVGLPYWKLLGWW